MDSIKPNRREFLGIVGGLAGATIAAGAWAAPTEPAGRVRIGVAGGSFGAGFHWHEDPGCEVYGVSDLLEDRLQNLVNRYGCERTYPSLEAMIDDENIDAIAVFTGAPDHVRHCVAAMEAGKHVISAVPAALTLEGCAELVATKERTGAKYMMAETSYYRWPCITARRLFADGAFGVLKYVEGEYYHPMIGSDSSDLMRMPKREGGGPTWRFGLPPMLYLTHSSGFLVGVSGGGSLVSCIGTLGWDVGFWITSTGTLRQQRGAVHHIVGQHLPLQCDVERLAPWGASPVVRRQALALHGLMVGAALRSEAERRGRRARPAGLLAPSPRSDAL